MKTIEYSKHLRNDSQPGYTDLDDFIISIKDALDADHVVEIILEPGDATRYTLTLLYCNGHLMMFNESSCHCFYFTAYTITNPGGTKEGINVWTHQLMLELARLIFGNKKIEPMYNWKKGCPIINGKDAR